MELKPRVQEDLIAALKAKDEVRSGTLRLLLAAIVNKEKEGREVPKEQLLDVVAAEAKKRREAAEAFEKGGRVESAQKEKDELEILLSYLPEQLSREELEAMVREAVVAAGAQNQKDMGRVMAELAPKVRGKADGSLVASLVKEALS